MKTLFLFCLLLLIQPTIAQELGSKLEQAYDSFENERVDSLLIEANKNIINLSLVDKVVFHKYSAFKAFQNGEQQIVMDHFKELITINPSYTLDALATSPKLVMLFDKAKIEYLEEQQRHLSELTSKKPAQELPWRSLVFPGWEQWNRGAKTKAYTWAALGAITLAGTVQSLIRTSSKRQIYLDEENPDKIKTKFSSYNSTYRSQFYWTYALSAVWVTSHIDAVFFTNHENKFIVIMPGPNKEVSVNIAVSF